MAGSLVGDRYEILETIGEGGFAITHRAWDTRLERAIAIKMLRPHYASDERFVHRFVREARAAASVSHPNVVRLYDFGQDGGTVFIAMQYVQGQTLRDLMRRFPGGMAEGDAIGVITPVLRGLSAIHAAGIVHRDVKPDNVLIDREGQVLITDFGIALLADSSRLTGTDATFGTAAYMSPEQGRGEPVGPPSDIYAAGIVLFEMLTGKLPFSADNPVAMMMAHQDQIAPLASQVAQARSVSQALDFALARALAKAPRDRFQSATEFLTALSAPVQRPSIPSPPETRTMPLPAAARPRPVVAVPAAAPRRQGSAFWTWLLLAILIVGVAVVGVAYAAGLFEGDGNSGSPLVVAPSPTAEGENLPVAEPPTIEAVVTATDMPEPTEPLESPTPTVEEDPVIIVSEVPDSTPGSDIEQVDEVDT